METYKRVDAYVHAILTSALVGQLHASAALNPGKPPPPRYPLNGRLDRPQNPSGRHGEEKILPLPGLEFRSVGRPARSKSLYWLRHLRLKGKSVPGIKRAFRSFLQIIFETFFTSINIRQVTLQIRAEKHVGLNGLCPSPSFYFNNNFDGSKTQ
jgi:hypothetical protein